MFVPRETPRLLLRRIREDDGQSILRYMSDPKVTVWLPEGTLNAEQAREFAVTNSGAQAKAVGVVHKTSQMFVGHMIFHPWFGARTHEIGWVFAREHQGLGYATEAATALLAYAFEALECHRVIATCQPENKASWRVMEKLGMRREAHFRKGHQLRPGGEWWDEYFYALLSEEYASTRPTDEGRGG